REISDLRAQRRSMERAQATAQATASTNNSLAEVAPSVTDSSAGGVSGSWPSAPAYPPSYAVADAVREITMAIVQNDYGVQLCFEHLRHIENPTPLTVRCEEVMDAYVQGLVNDNAMRQAIQQVQIKMADSVADGQISADSAAAFMSILLSGDGSGESGAGGGLPPVRAATNRPTRQ
ncbi:MAG: hypothetical protein AAFR82_10995, partial [Pseudomonadota bacterium]